MFSELLNLYKDSPSDYNIMSRFAHKTEQDIINEKKCELLKEVFYILKQKYNVCLDMVSISKSQRLTALFKNILQYEMFYYSEKYSIAKNELIKSIEEYQNNNNGVHEKNTLPKLSVQA